MAPAEGAGDGARGAIKRGCDEPHPLLGAPDIRRVAGIVERRRLGDAEANERDAVVPQVHLLERGHPPGGSG